MNATREDMKAVRTVAWLSLVPAAVLLAAAAVLPSVPLPDGSFRVPVPPDGLSLFAAAALFSVGTLGAAILLWASRRIPTDRLTYAVQRMAGPVLVALMGFTAYNLSFTWPVVFPFAAAYALALLAAWPTESRVAAFLDGQGTRGEA